MVEREPLKAAIWVDDFYDYYNLALTGQLPNVIPNASTFALALRVYVTQGHPDEELAEEGASSSSSSTAPTKPFNVTILENIVKYGVDPTEVITDRSVPSDEIAGDMVRALIRATTYPDVEDRTTFREIALTLARAQQLGRHLQPDALDAVEPVIPVMVENKVCRVTLFVRSFLPVLNPAPQETEVQEVPFNLKVLRDHLEGASYFRRMLPSDQLARQYLLERSVLDIASERLKRVAEQIERLGMAPDVKDHNLQSWIWDWHQKLVERLKQDIRKVRREENRSVRGLPDQRGRVAPFLELLKVEKLSLITILEIIRLHGSGGVTDGMKTARALVSVGKAIELEYKAELSRKHGISVNVDPRRRGEVGPGSLQELHQRRIAARMMMEDAEEWATEWSQHIRVRVGAFLVYRLIEVATVMRRAKNERTGKWYEEEHPAFSHSYEYFRGCKLGTVRVASDISEAIARDNLRDTLHPRHLPMLVPPAPWVNWNSGGYLTIPSHVMRFKDSVEQKELLKKAISENKMDHIFAGLDALGATPWRINRDVFEVVLRVWNSGQRLGKIPPAQFEVPEPEKLAEMEYDPAAKAMWITRMKKWTQDKAANHSERCSVNYKIEIARAFLNDVFYLPHNLDFRGRAYPLPPHLNHIGNDLSRGLLLFAEGKPLGARGLRWLKIHLANLYGYDKATFDERVAFVDARIDEIRDSAKKPLEGRGWWMKADDPWQCLSTCMQLVNALDSADPLAYECPLPVHQDGTCNGLQHYAALGGDSRGAAQVNLDVAERPSDVYTYVADMVEKRIDEDLQSEHAKDRHFAEILAGKVARKVVKQTVMTTVYGVTFVGAREQIEKQLRDRGDVPAEDVYLASAYLARQVLRCIGDLFKGANEIMNWLTLSARMIAKSIPADRVQHAMKMEGPKGTWRHVKKRGVTSRVRKEQMGAVIWTTLMGLPVAQPYRKVKRKQIQTQLQSVFISDPNVPAEVNSQKQASAFPPNFIHSLDATHMLMTALACQDAGMTFAAVHDSYWTHACDIDPMSDIIRETFIRLHSTDVLALLEKEFRERYREHRVPVVSMRTASVLKSLGVLSGEAAEMMMEAPDGTVEALEADEESRIDLKELTEVSRRTKAETAEEEVEDAEEGPKMSAAELAEASRQLEGRFVKLVDLLPRLPQKGEFDVRKIRDSLYFFS
ncbi:hypothetical protein K488DRAFT_47601 [Vararia minispora EC-137]|uniref:Uncharacterized protein n=1 Tax=Vararia minispora EC-137 TaxID=1314806 RepID=A0ACB8QP86_9AGAM|nr:hypothetical protein K488DRAFT_47601 [Vararia minispora EC-137]